MTRATSFSGGTSVSRTEESPENGQGLDVGSLPHGPHDPVTATPPRPPGSVRRTTSIDQRRGERGAPMEVEARGRDLVTRLDGTAVVRDAVTFTATVDPMGTLLAIESDPPEPRLATLVGAHVSRGFRARLDEVLPDHRDAATVLHQLLDDMPMAALISSYGSSREQTDFRLPPEAGERLTDLCAGWAAGATMLDVLGRTGVFPIPVGPPAPDLVSDDSLAWHELPVMVPRSVRRRRRLDVLPGAPLVADVHFRDSHLGADEPEDVLHEYLLTAAIDPAAGIVLRAAATARVLPWPECPGATASAGHIVGQPLTALRALVAADFTGTSTCTHLNDVLRSLAGLTTLLQAVDQCEAAAEGVRWMLEQPAAYSGRRESMLGLRQREGIMRSHAAVPTDGAPVTELFDGLAADTATMFADPHAEEHA